MLERGEFMAINVRRRHGDGTIERRYVRGTGVRRGFPNGDEETLYDDLGHPDDLADWLEELAAQVRSSRGRRGA